MPGTVQNPRKTYCLPRELIIIYSIATIFFNTANKSFFQQYLAQRFTLPHSCFQGKQIWHSENTMQFNPAIFCGVSSRQTIGNHRCREALDTVNFEICLSIINFNGPEHMLWAKHVLKCSPECGQDEVHTKCFVEMWCKPSERLKSLGSHRGSGYHIVCHKRPCSDASSGSTN